MSDIAIRAEGLSKLYRLGTRERYRVLRDTLTDTLTADMEFFFEHSLECESRSLAAMTQYNINSLVKQVRPTAASDAVSIARWFGARSASRKLLNSVYSLLSIDEKAAVHGRFSKIFRDYEGLFDEGVWRISFGGRPLVIPLRSRTAWLDWDAALSIQGHEPELKETYAFLIGLKHPPRLVLDIGANYGTHSIIFLSHSIQTISFEPNPRCHAFFHEVCQANGLQYQLEPVALGGREGSVDLCYPEREEWLGTTDPNVMGRLGGKLFKMTVPQTTVDSYVESHGLEPDLLKIDTEGTDIQVLTGALRTVTTYRPIVLFEGWQSNRAEAQTFMDSQRYRICGLPLRGNSRPRPFTAEAFDSTTEMNFAGLPDEMLQSWPPDFSILRT